MKQAIKYLNKLEFEYRIFVSLGIVIFTCFLSFNYYAGDYAIVQIIGNTVSAEPVFTLKSTFVVLSVVMIIVSLLRMWAGSLLSSKRVMSFKIKDDMLVTAGPYKLTRNPIYFSDIAAITGFSLCLPLPGILMPVLFYLHYVRLIKYEESFLSENFRSAYKNFSLEAPRLIPNVKSIRTFMREKNFFINYDGFINNSLYLLFIPGFIAAAFTYNFVTAIIIGSPGVVYWAVVHTRIGTKKDAPKKKNPGSKVFSGVLYSQCWEDPRIDRTAFNITENDTVFSITSGGCNLLAFLIDNPKKVIALDLNPHQNYLLELKMAAIRNLDYNNFISFLGVTESAIRLKIYDRIKENLSAEARNFWDKNTALIENGIIHCGRFENYMKLLRTVLNLIIGRKNINKFFRTFGKDALAELYNRKWNNRRWKLFTKILLSRKTMSLLFDKSFFKYVNDTFSFGDHFAVKTWTALTCLPIRSNNFLSYILLGNYYDVNNLPLYLRRENFNIIKTRLDRVSIINDNCENYFSRLPESSVDKFNFTNIFEWMSEQEFEKLLTETIRVASDNAVITYRNLLVPREHPASLSAQIRSRKQMAELLHRRDLSFIYNNYVVEEITKEEAQCFTEQLQFQNAKS